MTLAPHLEKEAAGSVVVFVAVVLGIVLLSAGMALAGGPGNTALGTGALQSDSSGTNDTALGFWALLSNTSGSTKTVIPRLRRVLEVVRPGIFATFQSQGPVSSSDRMNSIRLLGQEVLPALREFGNELGLVDPSERAPGSRPYIPGTQLEQLADPDLLKRPL